jgi:heme A synthase
MSLAEFKRIFWMEWAHRQVGRTIGLAYLLPMGYFIGRGYVSRSMALRLVGIGGLIGTQVRLVASPRIHTQTYTHTYTASLSLSLFLWLVLTERWAGGWVGARRRA